MTEADCNNRIETTTDGARSTAEPQYLQSVVRQIRICRSTLGAVLDVLETSEIDTDSVDRAAEGSMNVMAEIEQLWSTLKSERYLPTPV
jgi:hypothetical protein